MEHFKYSILREKWRRYFDEGQRDVFNTGSAEESNDNRPIPNQNKTYVELFKFVPTKHSEDFTFTREDNASCLISEENSVVPTDATVKSKLVGLLAVEHKVEQQPDSPKLQEPHEMDNGTVSKFTPYEQNTYANDLEPMMQPQMPQLRECHDMESREVHVRGNFALYEPCLGDLLKPEFAELQKLKLEQTIDYISSQQFEYKQNMTRRPDLLIVRNLSGASNKKIYTLEELAGPIKPVVSHKHKSKFARKVDRMCEQFQGDEENNLQPDLIKLQNSYHVERKKVNIWDIIKQQKLYLTQPFRHQIAQYKFKLTQRLEPILEESETTLEQLVEPELEQQQQLVKQNSNLGYYLNEYNLEQETESEVSHDEDYEESVVAASPLGSRTGDIVEELLNYVSYVAITIFIFLFSCLLCICKVYNLIMYDEDESSPIKTCDEPPADDVDQSTHQEALKRVLDQMQAGPQPEFFIQPIVPPNTLQSILSPEQYMEEE
ncbi:hypothetical protein RR48_15354 [Papilio machaon]|uniref:Uncharacterized protein n=1 Tax=Papilio machaon TaxID=76193 RepID=A0A194QUK8_PAPMA|nr:hypothetical protein RR48_15354 [Papilio machaon]